MIRGPIKPRNPNLPSHPVFLLIACGFSLLLCSLLSGKMFGAFYINWGLLPAFIGILYGSSRTRTGLVALMFGSMYVSSLKDVPSHLLLNSGLLMCPLLFGMSGKFRLGSVMEKVLVLWAALVPSLVLMVYTSAESGWNYHETDTRHMLLISIAMALYLAAGALYIYLLETTWDKLEVDGRIASLSEKFRQETDNLRQITDMVPMSIIALDDNFRIISLNETLMDKISTRLPGVTKGEIVNRTAFDLIHMLKLTITPEIDRMLSIIQRKQRAAETVLCYGRVIHFMATPLMSKEENKHGGMVIVIQDMTEEEKIRSELSHVERLSLVGQMAAGITHEIRNPMAVVRGFLQLMHEKCPPDMESYFQIVMEELDRANGIINDFLSLARSGLPTKEDVNLHVLLDELAPLLWADANLRGQSVELKLCESLPALRLNSKEIKQVILNLGRNGMEAMQPKGVLTLETRCALGRAELLVRDTGSGMTETELGKLFTPFFTTKEQGTGLGLPLCLSIIERHGGTITVESAPGAGTVFTVSLPCEAE
ncbi:PAS domain S-box protein [Paenibacillus sp. HN-1]|uniref:two-component system sensor histidine kinase NtrB n=1 Tax=Paenibacillus TaxID=44249 RepID=UPI001CA9BD02|nr:MULTISPECIES: ATP-binding protein [Paenibacillus]MBY9079863.1 PAS domain S-box protein [Paenibacillus sp. CGMCC 1.18879]MBY9084504.1 PAS domain S-box protein [Paenibacillus sinensis]